MSKLERLWDWFLPGLISLSPIGVIAYNYDADAEDRAPYNESKLVARHAMAPAALRPAAVIPIARV